MLIKPAIEQLAEKAGNKYILCNVVSKRAKEIVKAEQNNEEMIDERIKEITKAAQEFESGDFVIENRQNEE